MKKDFTTDLYPGDSSDEEDVYTVSGESQDQIYLKMHKFIEMRKYKDFFLSFFFIEICNQHILNNDKVVILYKAQKKKIADIFRIRSLSSESSYNDSDIKIVIDKFLDVSLLKGLLRQFFCDFKNENKSKDLKPLASSRKRSSSDLLEEGDDNILSVFTCLFQNKNDWLKLMNKIACDSKLALVLSSKSCSILIFKLVKSVLNNHKSKIDNLSYVPEIELLYNELERAVVSVCKIVPKVTMSDFKQFRPVEIFCPNFFLTLANIKFDSKLVRGYSKGCIIRDSSEERIVDESSNGKSEILTINCHIEKILYGDIPVYSHIVSEDTTIHLVNYARSDLVKMSSMRGSYKDIKTRFNDIKDSSSLIHLLKKMLKSGSISTENEVYDKDNLIKVFYLFFKCETTRNPSAFLTNIMFFDLVEKGVYKFSDFLDFMPMVIVGAVDASRSLLRSFSELFKVKDANDQWEGYLFKKYSYDLSPVGVNHDSPYYLVVKDMLLFFSWLNSLDNFKIGNLSNIINNLNSLNQQINKYLSDKEASANLKKEASANVRKAVLADITNQDKLRKEESSSSVASDKVTQEQIAPIIAVANNFIQEKIFYNKSNYDCLMSEIGNLLQEWYGVDFFGSV